MGNGKIKGKILVRMHDVEAVNTSRMDRPRIMSRLFISRENITSAEWGTCIKVSVPYGSTSLDECSPESGQGSVTQGNDILLKDS
mgnify:CR=1 FL=1